MSSLAAFDSPAEKAVRSATRDWAQRQEFPANIENISTYQDLVARAQHWAKMVCANGALAGHWPPGHGGNGHPETETAVFIEEAMRHWPRRWLDRVGFEMIAPMLLQQGTAPQREQFLPGIRTGTERWAIGFSEPDAGSDLTKLTTTARPEGGQFVVNGEKIWSGYAQDVDYYLLLARSDPDSSGHRGLSCLIVDLTSEGVTIEPIDQIVGEAGFSRVLLNNVVVPAENLVGEQGSGWSVVLGQLRYERTSTILEETSVLGFCIDRLIEHTASTSTGRSASIESQLGRVWAVQQGLAVLNRKVLRAQVDDDRVLPESYVTKLVWSQTTQELSRLAFSLLGDRVLQGGDEMSSFWQWQRLEALSQTIYSGASEIMRSLIAEHVLDLPRSR